MNATPCRSRVTPPSTQHRLERVAPQEMAVVDGLHAASWSLCGDAMTLLRTAAFALTSRVA